MRPLFGNLTPFATEAAAAAMATATPAATTMGRPVHREGNALSEGSPLSRDQA